MLTHRKIASSSQPVALRNINMFPYFIHGITNRMCCVDEGVSVRSTPSKEQMLSCFRPRRMAISR